MLWFADIEAYGEKYLNLYGKTKAYATYGESKYDDKIFDIDLKTWILKLIDLCSNKFIEDEDKDYQKNLIYFHNGGKFDFKFILPILKEMERDERKYKLSHIIEGNRRILTLDFSFKLDVINNGKRNRKTMKFSFRDSARLWPLSVKQLGESINLPKLGVEEYDILDEFKTNQDYFNYNNGDDWKYLQRDVHIIKNFARETKDMIDLENCPLTSASMSLKEMIKWNPELKWCNYWIKDKTTWDAINDAFNGGFTFANPLHQLKILNDVFKYDVNSLYPYIMESNSFPVGEPIYNENDNTASFIIYKLTADKATAKSIPFFPFKTADEANYENPIDDNEQYKKVNYNVEVNVDNYMLEFLEKWYKFENIKIEFIVGFRERYNMFSDFVNHWKELKIMYDKQKNEAKRTIVKIIVNAGYGKTAQNPEREIAKLYTRKEIQAEPTYVKKEKTEYVFGRRINKMKDWYYVIEDEPMKRTKKGHLIASYIPIATKITSLARIKLLENILEIPNQCVYFDTDSIHSKIPLDDYLHIEDSEFGAWKYEGRVGSGVYRRAKHYLNTDIELPKKDKNGNPIIKDYLLKGGGFNVNRFNETKEISLEQYLQPEFEVERGKITPIDLDDGRVLTERTYKFTMPNSYMNRKLLEPPKDVIQHYIDNDLLDDLIKEM